MKDNKNKLRIKQLCAFIIGLTISTIIAYASTYASSVVYYNKTQTNILTSENVQSAITELATDYQNYFTYVCPSNKECIQKKTTLAVGDYVRYTPSSTSYQTDTSKTNYTSPQTINPSELNLWRVLSINGNGTVDIISEYVSSVDVYFRGQTGYQNFVGYLNVLAAQYENTAYTSGSRHFGYNGQTAYITDTSKFVNPAPWTCNTGGTCSPDPDDYESSGGGDTLYTTDYNLVNTVLGTRKAYKVGTTTATEYWMASRSYGYISATEYGWYGRFVEASGSYMNCMLYDYFSSMFFPRSNSWALRPIVTLKSGLSYYGIGSKDNPIEIVG